MSRTKTDKVYRKYFGSRFSRQFDKFKDEHKGTTQTSFGKLLDPPASRGSVKKYYDGEDIPSPERLKQIREIFGVNEDYFNIENATHDELYTLSSEYMTEVGRDTLSQFCEEIGLDLRFLYVIRELIGSRFDDMFPTWTPLAYNWINESYFRLDRSVWSESAEMDPDVRVLQYKIQCEADGKKTEKLIPFTRHDLRFIKDLQTNVLDYVEFLLMKQGKDLKRDGEIATEKAQVITQNGLAVSRKLSAEELNMIDKYSLDSYTDQEGDK